MGSRKTEIGAQRSWSSVRNSLERFAKNHKGEPQIFADERGNNLRFPPRNLRLIRSELGHGHTREQTRRAFLAVIRSAFAEINSNFKIEIKQMIPVPGHPEVLVSYNDLIVHEEMNEPEILISELRKKFSVRELLDGVEDSNVRLVRNIEEIMMERRTLPRMPEDLSSQSPRPVLPRTNNPTGSILSYVLAFIVLLGAIVAAAVVISKWVSIAAGVTTGVVIIGALLAIGVVGAFQLRNDDRLSEESFLKLMIESYKRLPLLRGER